MAQLDDRGGASVDATTDAEGAPVISLHGELDISTVPSVELEVRHFAEGAADRVVFDLSDVAFMDSSGLAMLLRVAQRTGYVVVRKPSAIIQRVIEATGLSETFHLEQ